MALVDTSRAPLGEFAASALVDAVVANDDRVERHYLEIKSGLDLTTKKDQAKIAKFILGAANHMPDRAAKAFEGYGVMVVGASLGSASGIPPIEALEIQKAVLPFIGADGPHYDLLRVPCAASQNEVLVIVVDPPRWGDQPFICRKDGAEGLRDGAVFVRADGETRESRGDELTQLIQRGQRGHSTNVDLGVRVVGVVRPVVVDLDQTLDEFVRCERSRLLAPLKDSPSIHEDSSTDPVSRALIPSNTMAQIAALSVQETRSRDAYLAEVDGWEADVREAWDGAVIGLIGHLASAVEIEVTNRTKSFLRDVELKLHIEGPIFGVECLGSHADLDSDDLGIPQTPRIWGPRSKFNGLGINAASYAHLLSGPALAPIKISRTSWNNSGSVDWLFSVGQLRPLEVDVSNEEELVLYTFDSTCSPVHGSWEVTAHDHNEVYTGSMEITMGEVLDLTPILRRLLGIDSSDES